MTIYISLKMRFLRNLYKHQKCPHFNPLVSCKSYRFGKVIIPFLKVETLRVTKNHVSLFSKKWALKPSHLMGYRINNWCDIKIFSKYKISFLPLMMSLLWSHDYITFYKHETRFWCRQQIEKMMSSIKSMGLIKFETHCMYRTWQIGVSIFFLACLKSDIFWKTGHVCMVRNEHLRTVYGVSK